MQKHKYIGSNSRLTPCARGDGITPGKRCGTESDTAGCPGRVDGKCCFTDRGMGSELHSNGYETGAFISGDKTEYYVTKKGYCLIPISLFQYPEIRNVVKGE